MLMISRRIGERIVIGDSVEVIVTEIHRRSVRLAVKSSRGQLVLRGEVRDAIESANKAAALAPVDHPSLERIAELESPHPCPGLAIASPAEISTYEAANCAAAPATPTISQSKQE
jgi:carbon storage regulator